MNDTRRFPFKTALNASTLFPFEQDVKDQVRVTAEAGFAGIELWVKDLEAYVAHAEPSTICVHTSPIPASWW